MFFPEQVTPILSKRIDVKNKNDFSRLEYPNLDFPKLLSNYIIDLRMLLTFF